MATYNAIQRAEVEDCGKAQGVEVGIDYTLLGSMNKSFAKSK